MKNQNESFSIKQPEIISDWLTRKQASRYLQCGISTLDTCIPVKKYYIGKAVRYLRSDLDSYLFSNCREPKSKEEK